MTRKDVIVSSSSGYPWEKLRCWANSIQRSGFSGDAYLILYDENEEIVKNLRSLGIGVFRPTSNHLGQSEVDVVVDRFYQKWSLINTLGPTTINRVITTDIHDVVFQSDPSVWLDNNLGNHKLFVTSEGIAYKHESWGRKNFLSCFGEDVWLARAAENTIFNCGVWGGISEYAAEMFLLIYLVGFGHPNHAAGDRPSTRWTDQAALNLISQMTLVKEKILFIKSEHGFAAQLGTFLAMDEETSRHLNEPRPFHKNGEVFTSGGEKFVIVHQYNRIPRLSHSITARYHK